MQFDEDKEKFFAKFSPEEVEKYKKETKAYKKKVVKRREKVAAIKNGTYVRTRNLVELHLSFLYSSEPTTQDRLWISGLYVGTDASS